jgi:hypothetical protein
MLSNFPTLGTIRSVGEFDSTTLPTAVASDTINKINGFILENFK